MSNELLDKLGNYFVNRGIRAQNCITFEQFVEIYQAGCWRECVE